MSERTTASWYPFGWLRWVVRSWLPWAFGNVGYWVRPYDMLADRRRWHWQPAERCGAMMWIDEESRIANRWGPFPHIDRCECWVCTHGGAA